MSCMIILSDIRPHKVSFQPGDFSVIDTACNTRHSVPFSCCTVMNVINVVAGSVAENPPWW